MATPQLSATSLAKLRNVSGRFSDGGGLFLVMGDKGSTFAALGAPAPHWRSNLRVMLDEIVANG